MNTITNLQKQSFFKGVVTKIEPIIIKINPFKLSLVSEIVTMDACNPRIDFNMVTEYAKSIKENGFDETKPLTIGYNDNYYFLIDGETRLRSLLLLQMIQCKESIISNIKKISYIYDGSKQFGVDVKLFNKILSEDTLTFQILRKIVSQCCDDLVIPAYIKQTVNDSDVYTQMLTCNLHTQEFNHHELAELIGKLISDNPKYPEWVKNLLKLYGVGERRLKTLHFQYKLSFCCKSKFHSLSEKDATSITRYIVDTYGEDFITNDQEICSIIQQLIKQIKSTNLLDKQSVELLLRGKRSKRVRMFKSVDALNVQTLVQSKKPQRKNRESVQSILIHLIEDLNSISLETGIIFSDDITKQSSNQIVSTKLFEQFCKTSNYTILPKKLTNRLDWFIIVIQIKTLLSVYKSDVLQKGTLFQFIDRYKV